MNPEWSGRATLVTGGASFIGSHLVDALLQLGSVVRVADDLSTGMRDNIADHVRSGRVELLIGDLRDPRFAAAAASGQDTVFHLAANHGGRGYIATHPVECSTNLILDGVVFNACREADVRKIVYASSGCVYPVSWQLDTSRDVRLSEDSAGPPWEADDLYGWAKLMGEFTLRAYYEEYGQRSAVCRLFTVYGPRCGESHAVMAMIARGAVRQDPFHVWGTGEQIRNWTYVDDVVDGLVRAAEVVDDATPVNLGTSEGVTVRECAQLVMRLAGYHAEIRALTNMPAGVLNRVADASQAKRLLGWEARVPFEEGLRRTFDWYLATKQLEDVRRLVDDEQALLTHASAARKVDRTGG